MKWNDSPNGKRGPEWLSFEAIARPSDERKFWGRVQLIGPKGLSVISDIDDTIKVTNVRNRKLLLTNTFSSRVQTGCRNVRAVPSMCGSRYGLPLRIGKSVAALLALGRVHGGGRIPKRDASSQALPLDGPLGRLHTSVAGSSQAGVHRADSGSAIPSDGSS